MPLPTARPLTFDADGIGNRVIRTLVMSYQRYVPIERRLLLLLRLQMSNYININVYVLSKNDL